MKDIVVFLKEALSKDMLQLFNGIFDVEIALFKAKRLTDINIKNDELKKNNDPIEFSDYMNNNVFQKIIKNKEIGFAFTSMILNKPNQFLQINDKKSEPSMYCYFKVNEDNVNYLVSLCMYDTEVTLIENYMTLINIESVNFVKDNIELTKIILKQFSDLTSSIGTKNYKGLAIKPLTDPHKSFLMKIGFKKTSDNENILIYDL